MVMGKVKSFFKKNALKSCFYALVKADGSAQAMSITTASRGKSRGLQIFLHGLVAEILYSGLLNAWLQKHSEKPTCDFEAEFFTGIVFFCTGRKAVFAQVGCWRTGDLYRFSPKSMLCFCNLFISKWLR